MEALKIVPYIRRHSLRICISKSCLVSLQHVHKVYFFHISKFGCAVHNIHNDTAKVKVVPESKNEKEDFGCIIVNIMYCTAKLGYVEEVYFVNMLQGN